MGIRCEQMIGLSPRGVELVKDLRMKEYSTYEGPWNNLPLYQYFQSNVDVKLEILKEKIDDCKSVSICNSIPDNIINCLASVSKWLEEQIKNDSRVLKYKQVVQAEPWSSGPCIFLCLEDMDGKRYGEWTDTEIESEC